MDTSDTAVGDDATPVDVRFGEPAPQHRGTVLVRSFMVIPHLLMVYVLGVAALVVVVIGWFGALFTGRLPRFAVTFITGWLRWSTRVFAYEFFLTGQYPPFSVDPVLEYPVDIRVTGGRLNRLAVLFRGILVLPAAVVATLAAMGMTALWLVCWVATLVLGRIPRPFFEAGARVVRYQARYTGYYFMLTSVYPRGLFGDGSVVASDVPGTGLQPDVGGQLPTGAGDAVAALPLQPADAGFAQVPPPGHGSETPAAPAPAFADVAVLDVPEERSLVPGRSASAWAVGLSGGGRVVLVLFLVLGAFCIAGLNVLVATIRPSASLTAQNEAAGSYNKLSVQALDYVQSMQECQTNQDLSCAERAAGTIAADINAYASALSSITFPANVTDEARSAVSAARHAASVLSAMSAAGSDSAAYSTASAELPDSLPAVDSTFSALNDALINNG
jgi:hypothetical protein